MVWKSIKRSNITYYEIILNYPLTKLITRVSNKFENYSLVYTDFRNIH